MNPFRSSPYRWLWCSTLGSSAAQGIERTATSWLALESGGGAVTVGLAFAARTAPSLLLGLAAGTIADRTDRRRQLVAVAAAALPLMALIAWLASTGAVAAWHVVAISFGLGCVQVFDGPARQALVLDTVGADAAPSAFSLHAFGSRLAMAAGALAAGALIPLAGTAACYLAVAAAYGLSAAFVSRVRAAPPHPTGTAPPFRRALLDAARLIVDVPAIRVLSISGIACEIFAFSHGTALPALARDVLAAGPEGLGALNAAASVGGTAVVLLLALLPARVRREPVMGAVYVLYGLALLTLGASGTLPLAVAAMFVVGACAAAFDILQQTLIQTAVPATQRGRAAGIWVLGVGSAPVGHAEMGFLVAAVGVPLALTVNGAVVVASAALLLARAPTYRWAPRA